MYLLVAKFMRTLFYVCVATVVVSRDFYFSTRGCAEKAFSFG